MLPHFDPANLFVLWLDKPASWALHLLVLSRLAFSHENKTHTHIYIYIHTHTHIHTYTGHLRTRAVTAMHLTATSKGLK
jgi:hypothetical protein